MMRSTAAEPFAPALAIVADDLTGAADVAGILRRSGVRVSLVAGDPGPGWPVPVAEAIVVGLRIRTARVAEAVERASAAADWLLRAPPYWGERPPPTLCVVRRVRGRASLQSHAAL